MAEANSKEVALLGKAEATPGVAVVPTPAANAIRLAERPALTLDFSPNDNKGITQSFGDLDAHIIEKAMKLDVVFRLRSGGSKGILPDFAPILDCAGHNVVATAGVKVDVLPVTATGSSRKTATFYYYEDGLFYKFVGAMASFSFDSPMDGYINAKCSIMAPYLEPTVAAIPAGLTYQDSEPVMVNTTDVITDAGTAIKVGAFAFESSVAVSERRLIGGSEIHMDDRPKPLVSLTKASLGTLADFTRLKNMTKAEIKAVYGAAGNRVTFTGAQGQFESLKPTADGIHVNRELGIALRGGDNAYSITID